MLNVCTVILENETKEVHLGDTRLMEFLCTKHTIEPLCAPDRKEWQHIHSTKAERKPFATPESSKQKGRFS